MVSEIDRNNIKLANSGMYLRSMYEKWRTNPTKKNWLSFLFARKPAEQLSLSLSLSLYEPVSAAVSAAGMEAFNLWMSGRVLFSRKSKNSGIDNDDDIPWDRLYV